MKQVSVTELKNSLSRYLRLAKRGEVIEIIERSVPIARIQGLPDLGEAGMALDELVLEGVVSRAAAAPRPDFLRSPALPCRSDVVNVLVDQRGDR
jgi:prevent-host-death family protein